MNLRPEEISSVIKDEIKNKIVSILKEEEKELKLLKESFAVIE